MNKRLNDKVLRYHLVRTSAREIAGNTLLVNLDKEHKEVVLNSLSVEMNALRSDIVLLASARQQDIKT